jgi:ribosomal protein S18 acetylase RimI-like enzyme
MIRLADAETIDAVIGLFEAQLQEHGIKTSRDDLRFVVNTVIADRRCGFMLVASLPDGNPIGVAYASSLLSLEHGGVSGWLEELYVLPQWRGQGIGSRLITEVVTRARELRWRALDLEVDASHQRAISLYHPASISTSFQKSILPSSLASIGHKFEKKPTEGSLTSHPFHFLPLLADQALTLIFQFYLHLQWSVNVSITPGLHYDSS